MAYSDFSVVFDGTGEFVDYGVLSELQFDRTDPFSASLWFKSTSSTDQALVGNLDTSGSNTGWEVRLRSSGELQFNFTNTGGGTNSLNIRTDITFLDGKWYHAVVTHDGTGTAAGIHIYVNAVDLPLTTLNDTLTLTTVSTATFRLGARANASFPFTGNLDDVAVYDKELDAAEVTTIFGSREPEDLTTVGPVANLVALWRMGDGDTFPTIVDHSASGNDGTMTNMVAGDIVGDTAAIVTSAYSLLFNGVNQYVDVGDVATYDFERTDTFSVSFWFRTTTTSFSTFVGKIEPGGPEFTGWSVDFDSVGGPILALINDVNTNNHLRVQFGSEYNDGFWHHAVLTYTGTSTPGGMTGYVDGVSVTGNTLVNNLSASIIGTGPFQIGGSENGSGAMLAGDIDDVAVYSGVALSLTQVRELYNCKYPTELTLVGPAASLVGYWKMGDGDTFPTVTDHSVSGNDGTMTNQTVANIQEDPAAKSVSQLSLLFDGVNDHAANGHLTEVAFERTDPFSFSLWFKTSFSGFQTLIGQVVSGGTVRGWTIALNAGIPQWAMINNLASNARIFQFGAVSFADGLWHHLVGTYNGNDSILGHNVYVDGQLLAHGTTVVDSLTAVTIVDATAIFTVAAESAGAGAQVAGNLDNIAIYDVELNTLEAIEVYGSGAPVDHTAIGPFESLVAYWRMGDGDTFPTLEDASLSRNTLTMTNMDAGDIVADVSSALQFLQALLSSDLAPNTFTGMAAVGLFAQAYDFDQGGGPTVDFTAVYQMRARNLVNTAYVEWQASIPDFTGISAPTPILPGSVVVVAIWGDQLVLQTAIPTAAYVQNVSAPAAAQDPAEGLGYVFVDTAAGSWSANDVITLPAIPSVGGTIVVKDATGSADTKPIVVNGNGNPIDGQVSVTIQSPRASLAFAFEGTEWKVL